MSVESQQLERAALERKDRDELHTIAVAMGGKPGSRARKAEIVDLILELAGVTEGPDNGEDAKPKKRATRGKAAAKAAPEDAGTDSDSENGAGASSPKRGSRSRAGTDESEGVEPEASAREAASVHPDPERVQVDNAASGEHTTGGTGSGELVQAVDAAGAQDKTVTGGGDGVQEEGGADQGVQQPTPTTHGQTHPQPQGGQGHLQRDDSEQGNRRRRRRGRDRDRQQQPDVWEGEPVEVEGLLDLRDEGYGFLRVKGYLPSKEDVYVPVKQVRQYGLRKGDLVKGASRPASRNEKNPALLRIDLVNGKDPELAKDRPKFENLTPLFPDEPLRLEVAGDPTNMTARIIDLVSPIGKGQRGLIVSPPKAGKTTIMKQIARSIETNNPEVHLMVLLVDERPEEVTDMRRWVQGEVIASTFDRPSDEHTMVAELAIERAKRMVEEGKDVVIILDGITRLARAYNLAAPATGRIMTGGVDTGALYPPKKFFGAARNIEEGGSLTILATALIETGSKMDEVIFEEFKGTGNMELRLDRRLAERRIYPAIDVDASSTRHEELLYDRKHLQMIWKLRRVLSGLSADGNSGAGLEMLIDRLSTFKTNEDFLNEVAKTPSASV
ncbi:MAG: transcription termination factor Rho [Acidimicrobiales bacterium]|nr:transcription termination factor Rho [Acidimicrobiales bacterium]